jgi:hypothetical protein
MCVLVIFFVQLWLMFVAVLLQMRIASAMINEHGRQSILVRVMCACHLLCAVMADVHRGFVADENCQHNDQ